MTVAIHDSILGTESIQTIVTSMGTFVMNDDQGDTDRVRVSKITGLHSLPEADDTRAPAHGRMGELSYPGAPRGKTITYEGTIQASTLAALRLANAQARAVLSERSELATITHDPDAAYGSVAHFYRARIIGFDADDAPVLTGVPQFKAAFVLGVRMNDPRYYVDAADSTLDTATDTLAPNNLGLAPTDPVITIDTPAADFTIEHDSGRVLTFADLDGAGALVVDFFNRTIVRGATDKTKAFVGEDSDWWDANVPGLDPGANSVVYDGGGDWSIAWKHANW